MEKSPIIQVGGSIETALKGEYVINVKAILKEAWHLTILSKKSINLALLINVLIGISITLLLTTLFGGFEALQENPGMAIIINILATIVLAPMLASLDMMGVLHSVGIKTDVKMVFSFWKQASSLALASLASSLLINLGFQLLILPGLYLLVALMPVVPLIIDKKQSPLKAIILSIQATRFQWLALMALYGFIFLLFTLACLPLIALFNSSSMIIGLIVVCFSFTYLIPMLFHVKGIVYREIFGLQLNLPEQNQVNGTFSA